MKKKHIFIIIGVIIGIIAAILTFTVLKDLGEEKKLKQEIDEVVDLLDFENLKMTEIEAKLNRTVTNNDYKIVEKAIKQYLSDSFNVMMEFTEILNDEQLTNILTAENYKQDGKEFTNTKKYISETKSKLENIKNEYQNLLTEDKIMSYINNKNLDSYYIDIYKDQTIPEKEDLEDQSVQNSIDDLINLLNTSSKIIDFLIQNKTEWIIEKDQILFKNNNLIDEYNRLLSGIQELDEL